MEWLSWSENKKRLENLLVNKYIYQSKLIEFK